MKMSISGSLDVARSVNWRHCRAHNVQTCIGNEFVSLHNHDLNALKLLQHHHFRFLARAPKHRPAFRSAVRASGWRQTAVGRLHLMEELAAGECLGAPSAALKDRRRRARNNDALELDGKASIHEAAFNGLISRDRASSIRNPRPVTGWDRLGCNGSIRGCPSNRHAAETLSEACRRGQHHVPRPKIGRQLSDS